MTERAGPGPKSFGPYELLDELGRGGFAVVHRARDTREGRLVALKILSESAPESGQAAERFLREARIVRGLVHPNIVAVSDAGTIEGRPYLAMDYVEGGTLAGWIGRKDLGTATIVAMLTAIAEGLACAHAAGVVHRDLKPQNILLDLEDRPRIADFGLARLTDGASTLTRTGQVMGTPNYMAPEQLEETRAVGPPTDVHALGVIAYQVVTGVLPYEAGSMAVLTQRILHGEPLPPRHLVPDCPRELEAVILKCLEKAPARRYPDAGALVVDLGRLARGERVRVAGQGAGRMLVRRARRLRPVWIAALLLLVVGLGGRQAWSIWSFRAALAEARRDLPSLLARDGSAALGSLRHGPFERAALTAALAELVVAGDDESRARAARALARVGDAGQAAELRAQAARAAPALAYVLEDAALQLEGRGRLEAAERALAAGRSEVLPEVVRALEEIATARAHVLLLELLYAAVGRGEGGLAAAAARGVARNDPRLRGTLLEEGEAAVRRAELARARLLAGVVESLGGADASSLLLRARIAAAADRPGEALGIIDRALSLAAGPQAEALRAYGAELRARATDAAGLERVETLGGQIAAAPADGALRLARGQAWLDLARSRLATEVTREAGRRAAQAALEDFQAVDLDGTSALRGQAGALELLEQRDAAWSLWIALAERQGDPGPRSAELDRVAAGLEAALAERADAPRLLLAARLHALRGEVEAQRTRLRAALGAAGRDGGLRHRAALALAGVELGRQEWSAAWTLAEAAAADAPDPEALGRAEALREGARTAFWEQIGRALDDDDALRGVGTALLGQDLARYLVLSPRDEQQRALWEGLRGRLLVLRPDAVEALVIQAKIQAEMQPARPLAGRLWALAAALTDDPALRALYQGWGALEGPRDAAAALRLARDAALDDPEGRVLQQAALMELGRFGEAADLLLGLEGYQDQAWVAYQCGLLLILAGRLEEGLKSLQGLLSAGHQHQSLHDACGRVLLALGRPAQALASLQRVVDTEQVMALRAAAHLAAGDYEETYTDATLYIRHHSEDELGYLLRGRALLELGRIPEAQQDFLDAAGRTVEQSPTRIVAWLYCGLIQFQAGDQAALVGLRNLEYWLRYWPLVERFTRARFIERKGRAVVVGWGTVVGWPLPRREDFEQAAAKAWDQVFAGDLESGFYQRLRADENLCTLIPEFIIQVARRQGAQAAGQAALKLKEECLDGSVSSLLQLLDQAGQEELRLEIIARLSALLEAIPEFLPVRVGRGLLRARGAVEEHPGAVEDLLLIYRHPGLVAGDRLRACDGLVVLGRADAALPALRGLWSQEAAFCAAQPRFFDNLCRAAAAVCAEDPAAWIACLREALEAQNGAMLSSEGRARLELGLVEALRAAGQSEPAQAILDAALARSPGDASVQAACARHWAARGERLRAAFHWRQVLALGEESAKGGARAALEDLGLSPGP